LVAQPNKSKIWYHSTKMCPFPWALTDSKSHTCIFSLPHFGWGMWLLQFLFIAQKNWRFAFLLPDSPRHVYTLQISFTGQGETQSMKQLSGGSKNCRCPYTYLCHTEMWSSTLLSFWRDWCSIGSTVQNCCWKYPFYHCGCYFFYFF